MSAQYLVELDPATRAFRMTCFGMWTPDVLDGFEREIDRHLRLYRAAGGQPASLLSLVDLRESLIQSQAMVTQLQVHTMRYAAASQRIAILLSHSAIQRAQVKRIVPPDKYRYFLLEAEALDWLDEGRIPLSMTG